MSIAEKLERLAYEDGSYNRLHERVLMRAGGKLLESSNWNSEGFQKTNGVSWSPTEVWGFEDGSSLEVEYSQANVCKSL